MIKLNEYHKYFLSGYVYEKLEEYEKSISYFEKAYVIKNNPMILSQIAFDYCYLKDYSKAREYAIRAVEEGYDGYRSLVTIPTDNDEQREQIMTIVQKGVEKRMASAMLAYTCFVDEYQRKGYLDMAVQYAKPEEKTSILFAVFRQYHLLPEFNIPSVKKQYWEYIKEYKALGCLFRDEYENISIFDDATYINEPEVLDILRKDFDNSALLIFSLMLLQEEFDQGYACVNMDKDCLLFDCLRAGKIAKSKECDILLKLCFDIVLDPKDIKALSRYLDDIRCMYPKYFNGMLKEIVKQYITFRRRNKIGLS